MTLLEGYIGREEWLAARKSGIGGSDVAKILGISKWGTPISVWMNKTRRTPDPDLSDNEAVEMGVELEDTVARIFTKRTGLKVEKRNSLFRSKSHPFMIANIDRKVVGHNKGLECKTTHWLKGDLWVGDELPDEYYAQVQHYIYVMDWDSCFIAALIGGQKFVWKEVVRDDAFIDNMIAREREFWEEYVIKDIMPPAIVHDDMGIPFPLCDNEELIQPTSEHIEMARQLDEMKAGISLLEGQKKLLENQLKQVIGDKQGIEGVATWKNDKPRTDINWEGVAIEVGATEDIIKKHSLTRDGSRRFLLKYKGGG